MSAADRDLTACCAAAYSSDVVDGVLPEALSTPAARIACVADAPSLDGYRRLLAGAGLTVTETERCDSAIDTMIDQIEARLQVLRGTATDRLAEAGIDPDAALQALDAARFEVAAGTVGYALVVAEKPRSADLR